MLIFTIILCICDLITTLIITSNGGIELNPIPLPILIPVKIFVIIGLAVIAIYYYIHKKEIGKLPLWPSLVMDAVYLFAVIHNIIAIIQYFAR